MEKITLPTQVQNIIDRLQGSGFEAYVVGGCVRDSIMGLMPHDWDICTSALPEQVIDIFKDQNVVPTGLKHGTVTVIFESYPVCESNSFEITTYRIEGDYRDNRHPEYLEFVSDISLDLMRRDFTINAMAYNYKDGLIDLFGGVYDIKDRVIKCVGNPDERFQEDALRILRAIRFASRLNYEIDYETKRAIMRNKELLKNISYERLNSEFVKIVECADFDILSQFKDVFAVFIPEIKDTFNFEQNNYHHKYNVYDHMMHAVDYSAGADIIVKLALFFHDIGKPITYSVDDRGVGHFYDHAFVSKNLTENIMRRLRFDNSTIDCVLELIVNHDLEPQPTEKFARKLLRNMNYEQALRLIEVQRCDKKAQTINDDSTKTLRNLDMLKQNLKTVIEKDECISLKNLAVNGWDLMALGLSGKEIGDALNKLLDMVIDEKVINVKEDLIAAIKVL